MANVPHLQPLELGIDQLLIKRHFLGILARSRGEFSDAQTHFERSHGIAETLSDPTARAAALNNLALVLAVKASYTEAIKLVGDAPDLLRQTGDRHREAALLDKLADFSYAAGQEAESRGYLERAVVIFAEIGEDDQPRPRYGNSSSGSNAKRGYEGRIVSSINVC